MKKHILFLFTALLCSIYGNTKEIAHGQIENKDSLTLLEFFADSTAVGNKGKNKIEARIFSTPKGRMIRIEFFSLEKENWIRKNKYEFEKDGITGIDPFISDFNNDGHADFNYRAALAARSANNVRRLFIYEPNGDSLRLIKNSLSYPNMVYNKELDCIDAWLIHGCSSQAFLRIEKDSLVPFAWIQLGPYKLDIYEIDKSGKDIYLKKDAPNAYGCYSRFKSYNPLIEYKQYPYE